MAYLFFDTETSDLFNFSLPPDHPSQPHIVSLAAYLGEWDADSQSVTHIASLNATVKPDGWHIAPGAQAIHGITEEYARAFGEDISTVLHRFLALCHHANDGTNGSLLIAHNTQFDHRMILRDCAFAEIDFMPISFLRPFCTMRALTPRMKLPPRPGAPRGSYKWPKLDEAYEYVFDRPVPGERANRHDAMEDLLACKDIFTEGKIRGWW